MQRITLDKSSVSYMYSEDIINVLQNMISDELSKDDDKVNTKFVDECVNALLEIEQDRDRSFAVLVPLFSDSEFLNIVSGKKRYFKRLNKFARAGIVAAVVAASTVTVNAAVAEITGVNLLKEAGVHIQRSIKNIGDGAEDEDENNASYLEEVIETADETSQNETTTVSEETTTKANSMPPVRTINVNKSANQTGSTTTTSGGIDKDYDDYDVETTKSTTKKVTQPRNTTTQAPPAIKPGDNTPDKHTLNSLEASFDNFKFDYVYGEELSYNGLTLTAVYNDGSRKAVGLSECDYTQSLNMNVTADYTLRVIYESCVVKIPITVRPDEETRGSDKCSNDDFEYLLTNRGAYITKYKGSAKNLDLSSIDGNTVYAVSAGVFENSDIQTVYAPEVKKIFANAFKGAKDLEVATFNQAVYIGDSAFEDCEKLSSASMASRVDKLGDAAYKNSGIKNITIPKGIESVPASLCEGCTKLESVELGGIETVERSAFEDCAALTSITGMGNVKAVGSFAFYGDEKAEIDETPSHLESVGDNGFAYCKKMAIKSLPNTVESIGEYAFMYVTKMESADIKNGITEIPAGAFWGTHLKTLTLPNGLKSIEQAAFMSTVIKEVTIPATVERIESRGLYSLTRMKVTFKGDTKLDENAFFNYSYLTFYVKRNTKPEEFAIEHDIEYETTD